MKELSGIKGSGLNEQSVNSLLVIGFGLLVASFFLADFKLMLNFNK